MPTTSPHCKYCIMSRYLTPSKIALLVLVYTYDEGAVPGSETAAILSYLISHILPDASHSSSASPVENSHVVPITAFEAKLSAHKSVITGRTVWDLFLKKVWAFTCADALERFLSEIPALLSKTKEQWLHQRETGGEFDRYRGHIRKTSPLGAFIRRAHLEYTRLQFHDAGALWQAFIAYRLPTRTAWEKKNPPNMESTLDTNFSDLFIDSSHPIAQIMYGSLADGQEEAGGLSTYDVERLMEFQVSELQRMLPATSTDRGTDRLDRTRRKTSG